MKGAYKVSSQENIIPKFVCNFELYLIKVEKVRLQ